MEVDPYSTSCIEPKAHSPKCHNSVLHGNSKKVEFFSQNGKNRLLKIWDDNNLDDEVIFTGLEESSDSSLREKVSDYVQLYLLRRARRLSMDKKLKSKLLNGGNQRLTPNKKFGPYEEFISNRNKGIDKVRQSQEVDRMTELLISGKIKATPREFAKVLEDPIYKINRLMESVRELEQAEIHLNEIPFLLETNCIRKSKDVFPDKINDTRLEESFVPSISRKSSKRIPTSSCITKASNIPEFRVVSVSSGFEDWSQSPYQAELSRPYQSSGLSMSNTDYIDESPFDQERARSFSLIPELTDEELSTCAELDYADLNISGDLRTSEIISPKSESEQLALFKKQNSCSVMYEMGKKVVDMYPRQVATKRRMWTNSEVDFDENE